VEPNHYTFTTNMLPALVTNGRRAAVELLTPSTAGSGVVLLLYSTVQYSIVQHVLLRTSCYLWDVLECRHVVEGCGAAVNHMDYPWNTWSATGTIKNMAESRLIDRKLTWSLIFTPKLIYLFNPKTKRVHFIINLILNFITCVVTR